MFGRKAKRIAELEEKLQDALENLVNVTVHFPPPAVVAFQAAAVRKGVWYQASAEFLVSDTWEQMRNIGIFEAGPGPYFDGSTPPTVGPKGTAGDSGASDD